MRSTCFLFADGNDDFQESAIVYAQAPPKMILVVDALPPLTECKWNMGVDELIKVVKHSNIYMRIMVDHDNKPECSVR